MTENDKICLESIESIVMDANNGARALIVAYAQGIVQGKKMAEEQMEADKAEEKKKEVGEDD